MTAGPTETDVLDARIAALEKQTDISARLTALEKDASTISAYLRAAAVIAAVFGLSGAWGLKVLSDTKDQLATANRQADTMKQQIGAAQQQLGTAQQQIASLNTRATDLSTQITRATSDYTALVSTDALSRKIDSVIRQIGPDTIRRSLPKPITVTLNNTTCGAHAPNSIRCFVSTGSLSPAVVTVSDIGSFPGIGTPVCTPGTLHNHYGLFIQVNFQIQLGLGSKYVVALYQPGMTTGNPAVMPPV